MRPGPFATRGRGGRGWTSGWSCTPNRCGSGRGEKRERICRGKRPSLNEEQHDQTLQGSTHLSTNEGSRPFLLVVEEEDDRPFPTTYSNARLPSCCLVCHAWGVCHGDARGRKYHSFPTHLADVCMDPGDGVGVVRHGEKGHAGHLSGNVEVEGGQRQVGDGWCAARGPRPSCWPRPASWPCVEALLAARPSGPHVLPPRGQRVPPTPPPPPPHTRKHPTNLNPTDGGEGQRTNTRARIVVSLTSRVLFPLSTYVLWRTASFARRPRGPRRRANHAMI